MIDRENRKRMGKDGGGLSWKGDSDGDGGMRSVFAHLQVCIHIVSCSHLNCIMLKILSTIIFLVIRR